MNTSIKVSQEIGTLDASIRFNNFDLLHSSFSVEVYKRSFSNYLSMDQTFILGVFFRCRW